MADHHHKPSRYLPPYPIPPGATIKDFLEAQGMTQSELAQRMGRPVQAISEIINAKKGIVEETAFQLERVFDMPANFWISLEQSYRESIARIAEKKELENQVPMLDRFPYGEMIKRNIFTQVPKGAERVMQWLKFLRVSNFDALDQYINERVLAFHRSHKYEMSIEKLAVWLRIGKIESNELNLKDFNSEKLFDQLPKIIKLSSLRCSDALHSLQKIGEECGIAFLFVEGFKGLPVYGITRWQNKTPTIQLSLRGRTVDFIWFALMHEIGHVLLHPTQKVFIEVDKNQISDNLEDEANCFARDNLIPRNKYDQLLGNGRITKTKVIQLANDLEIDPGIIVGRLQHDRHIRHSWFNDLRRKFEV